MVVQTNSLYLYCLQGNVGLIDVAATLAPMASLLPKVQEDNSTPSSIGSPVSDSTDKSEEVTSSLPTKGTNDVTAVVTDSDQSQTTRSEAVVLDDENTHKGDQGEGKSEGATTEGVHHDLTEPKLSVGDEVVDSTENVPESRVETVTSNVDITGSKDLTITDTEPNSKSD